MYSTILLPAALDPSMIPPKVNEFGVDIKLVLAEAEKIENAKLINSFVVKATKGMISKIITPGALESKHFIAITATYFKALWSLPFEEEKAGIFRTPLTEKPITYLTGSFKVAYKSSKSGEVISLPLKNGAEFVIFKPASSKEFKLFDVSMLEGLSAEKIKLSMPKLTIESTTNLKKTLEISGFKGLDAFFYDKGLPVDNFYQKVVLKTTLKGVEASAVAISLPRKRSRIITLDIDHPYSFAIVITLYDGIKIPLIMGYIGDPTLTGSEEEAISSREDVALGGAGSSAGAGSASSGSVAKK